VDLRLGEALILLNLCLVLIALALVLNVESEKLGCLSCGGWEVFIAPTTKTTVGRVTVDGRTGHCPVRQPRHPTVRVLTVSTIGALTAWATGQSGAASDSHCSLSGAPSGAALTLRALLTLSVDRWSRPLRWRPLLRLAHRTVWCHTRQFSEL
jgi:hypothetical protein